jgi:hypothetical protein
VPIFDLQYKTILHISLCTCALPHNSMNIVTIQKVIVELILFHYISIQVTITNIRNKRSTLGGMYWQKWQQLV